MSDDIFLHAHADRRLFGLNKVDWLMLLAGGFGVMALAFLLI